MEAALLSARELGVPIFAMTIVLVVVFIPIGFQKGITGALFSEFVFTLAGSVVISGIVALTLSPMMCSKLLKHDHNPSKFLRTIDGLFLKLENGFRVRLRSLLTTWQVLVILGALILLSLGYLFATSKTELAPTEDRGLIYLSMTGPPNATVNQMQTYANQMHEIASKEKEFMQMFQLTFANSGFGGILLKDWDERSKDSLTFQKEIQQKFSTIAGIRAQAFHMPALPGATGAPLQMIIKTTEPYENLNEVTLKVVEKLYQSGLFFFVDSDLKINKPQDILEVDKDKIAALGMTQQDVANELSIAMSGGYVNYFAAAGRSYRVIPQVLQVNRLNTDQILNQTIRTPKGDLIQVRNIAKIVHKVIPTSINHFQQLNSAQLVGAFLPTVSEGEIIDFVTKTIHEVAPTGYSVDYSGPTRQSVQESGGFVGIMLFSIAIVFLVLAAQYNSFRDPIVVLVSVPMAIFGALIFINLGWTTINIYTKVGLVTLVGLISKHGILIVDFANHLQADGRSKLEAIIEATSIRLRPILMTTAAMVFGVIPLVLASGAGAAGTSSMGKVIFTGLALGTFFTLFVVPAMYYFLAADHHQVKEKNSDGATDDIETVSSH
jgi:multidrug efflux pump